MALLTIFASGRLALLCFIGSSIVKHFLSRHPHSKHAVLLPDLSTFLCGHHTFFRCTLLHTHAHIHSSLLSYPLHRLPDLFCQFSPLPLVLYVDAASQGTLDVVTLFFSAFNTSRFASWVRGIRSSAVQPSLLFHPKHPTLMGNSVSPVIPSIHVLHHKCGP
uniref:Uncharacterized protein TCIL3000_10_9490 n=1 Tax=Trypanosoma congolense (strain IL3000) TaxID=1068625 RepID=G0UXQ4_TRYCI|nr:unnamed protein product [Trypanosoma congolense IL3000]